MNKRQRFFNKMNINIILIIFNVMIFSSIVLGSIIYVLSKLGLLVITSKLGSLTTILLVLLSSMIIGTSFSCIFVSKALSPLLDISDATKRISVGDFNVRVKEIKKHDDNLEVNQLIRNFNKMVERLSKIETIRYDFVTNVSHEFKAPLATINGYVTLLSDENLPKEEREKYISIIQDSTTKLTSLITNILKVSTLENQKVTINPKAYNLCEQIREIIILQEKAWTKRNITFDLDFSECIITSDEELLKTVWSNLISNAIKYSHLNSTVYITVMKKDKYAIVKIKDNGIGMNNETKMHIFDKFFQGDKSHSIEGNGLGMAIVSKILPVVNGIIEIDSEEGVGSTFSVILPLTISKK